MLEDCFVESRRSWSQKKPLTVTLSVAIHSCVLGVLILIPLFQIQVLPQVQPIPPLPTLGPRNDRDVLIVHIGRPGYGGSRPSASAAVLISPTVIPSKVEFGGDVPEPEILAISGSATGPGRDTGPGFAFGFQPEGASLPIPPPPDPLSPPLPAPKPVYKSPLRVGGDVQQANLLEHPTPIYPKLAINARVQGLVVLEAVITKEGNVDSLRVVSGHPLLVQAALDAVRQWRYRPTLLNGEPVEVITTITINFAFQ